MDASVGSAQPAGDNPTVPAGGGESARSLPAGTASPYQALAAAINAQVSLIYHTTITLLQYPSQGNFLWYYENANQVFNNGTFGYLSARVSAGDEPGLAQLSGPGGFPNAYAELLSQLRYTASTADQASHSSAVADQVSYANQLLVKLQQATYQPSDANGGMPTVDPNTGAISAGLQVGYAVNSPLATIQAALQLGQPTITVTVPAGSGATATISYPGCQLVALQPAAWQQATNTGWYYPDPIAEAFANGQRDVTGFHFTSTPAYQPGPLSAGGDLGLLVSLLICNPPTVSFSVPPTLDAVLPPAQLAEQFYDTFSLVNLGQSASPDYAAVTDQRAPSPDTVGADGVGASVPQLQQSAYVIGACLGFPAGS